MHIIPVASGKGGVGKSLFVANLGVALGQAGKRVVLVDLDLGGSNLHLILGARRAGKGIGFFLNETKTVLTDYLYETDYLNVAFIPGDSEIPGMSNLAPSQKRKIISHLGKLDADYLLLDLGAGSSINTIDFFLLSGAGTIITTPTPTALVNAYVFLKNTMFRLLHTACKKGTEAAKFLARLEREAVNLQRVYIRDLLDQIRKIDPESHDRYLDLVRRFRPRLVMNILEDPKDADKAHKLRRSCQQYLGIDLEHLGVMYRDEIQDVALGAGLPITVYKPKSILSQAVFRIAEKVIQFEVEEDQQGILRDTDFADDSFETAEMEAQLDFQSKIEYLEDLLQTGALSMGDLLETVRNQQYEIQQLKKENALFKHKLLQALQPGFRG